MRSIPARRRAVAVTVLVALCAGSWIVALAQGPTEIWFFLPLAVSLTLVGAFLTLRVGTNPIGRLLLGWALIVSYCCCVTAWGAAAVRHHHRIGVPQEWLSLAVPVVWHPGFIMFIVALLLFPHGRFLSARWRNAAGVIGGVAGLLAVANLLAPASAMRDYVPGVPAPYVSPAGSWAAVASGVLLSCIPVGVLVGVVGLVVRQRRTHGDDRRQITAFVLPTAAALALFVTSIVVIGDGRLGAFLFAVLPVSLGVAIMKFRLYAVDRIVSRTVSYGLVTALVVGVYVGIVQLVGLAFPHADAVAVTVATLAAVALFTPVRRRVQRWVDRRFNRTRYDHDLLTKALGTRLRRIAEMSEVQIELVTAIDRSLRPTTISVWMRTP